MKKFILGYKLPMTQVFTKNGDMVGVTEIQAGPCEVTQVRTPDKDGYSAVQIAFDAAKHVKKPQIRKDGKKYKHTAEFRTEADADIKVGQTIDTGVFQPGDFVKVTGINKGRGFQGVVKRHGFRGGKKSHGHKDQLRMPGSLGDGGRQNVIKGRRMGGHMGNKQITVSNLEVVGVDVKRNVIQLKGAVPGAISGLIR